MHYRLKINPIELVMSEFTMRGDFMRNKSAKDLAFEKERTKFRSRIRELELEVARNKEQLKITKTLLDEKEGLIQQQEDWIARLLEYTEISKEELRMLIDSEKEKAELNERILGTLGFIGAIGEGLVSKNDL